jgi:ribosomal protein S18 acetylase RimI-like enzyme
MQLDQYKIKKLDIRDLSSIMTIFKFNYMMEQATFKTFVSYDDIENEISQKLTYMLENLNGWSVTLNDQIVGYMIGYETGPLFGKDLGTFVPLHGHGSILEHKGAIYQMLFNHAANHWTKHDIYSIAISMFAHDEKLKSFWFQNGFGMRCVDAIRDLDDIAIDNNKVKIKQIYKENVDAILSLHQAHNLYYRTSPIFMPNEDEDSKTDLLEWLSVDHRKLFGAYIDDKVVGYMRIQEVGESVITTSKKMMSITGAFVDPAYRGQKIASQMLHSIIEDLNQHGYQFIGVDYESINPNANQFWSKHFRPYSISLTRRIDERIKAFIK